MSGNLDNEMERAGDVLDNAIADFMAVAEKEETMTEPMLKGADGAVKTNGTEPAVQPVSEAVVKKMVEPERERATFDISEWSVLTQNEYFSKAAQAELAYKDADTMEAFTAAQDLTNEVIMMICARVVDVPAGYLVAHKTSEDVDWTDMRSVLSSLRGGAPKRLREDFTEVLKVENASGN